MPSNLLRAVPTGLPVQPIDRLKWEHVRIIDEINGVISAAGGQEWSSADIVTRVAAIFKFIERHQDSEERFLFPLFTQPGEELFTRLRREHIGFLRSSDADLSAPQSGNNEAIIKFLGILGEDLRAHFADEEKAVFLNSKDILSTSQMDILRINFATRKCPEI